MKISTSFAVALLIGWFGISLWQTTAFAEDKIPPLAALTTNLPNTAQAQFAERRQALQTQLATFRAAAEAFNAKTAETQTEAEYDALTSQRASYIEAAMAFNRDMATAIASVAANTQRCQKFGNNTDAGDQLLSTEGTANAGGDLAHNYDIGDARCVGSLPKPSDFVRDQSMNPATFTDREKNAPGMSEALKDLGDLQARRSQLAADIKKATDERNAQKDPAIFAKLDATLKQENDAYGNNLKALHQAEVKVVKLKRTVDATEEKAPGQSAAAKN